MLHIVDKVRKPGVEKSGVGGVILFLPRTSPPSHTVAVLHSIYGLDLCNVSTLQNWPHSPHPQVVCIIIHLEIEKILSNNLFFLAF